MGFRQRLSGAIKSAAAAAPKPDLADLLSLGGIGSVGYGVGLIYGQGWGLVAAGAMAFILGFFILARASARSKT